jgi:Protein of unknown function (DUF3237)
MNIKTEFIMELFVEVGEPLEIGHTPYGERKVVPITGGTFSGPNISGEVLPGGADWNVLRPDGVKEIWARYSLKTDDGVLISLINEGLLHGTYEDGNRYAITTPKFEVCSQKYNWLNRTVFVGTHDSDPERRGVKLQFLKVQ